MIPWEIEAREFANCNCDFGCPCQFNALPTHGDCAAFVGLEIDKGHFGEVTLDGLRAVGIMKWPGPIHFGKGEAFLIVDERASEAQRHAILTIMTGGETAPGATIFSVFASTLEKAFDPAFRKIDVEIDIDKRRGRVVIDGIIDATGTPILNPVTGAEHRARIDIPNGFEYEIAEVAQGSAMIEGPIPITLTASHAHFATLRLNNYGLVKSKSAA
jgi:hypothetical protein